MREILFRGKRADNSQWVEGHLMYKYHELSAFFVIGENVDEYTRVIPKTVGQFTGMTDSKSAKIFDSDILVIYIVREDGSEEKGMAKVIWDDHAFCIEAISGNLCDAWLSLLGDRIVGQICEFFVIGNTHDNPELL